VVHVAPVSLQVRVHAWKWTFHAGSIAEEVEAVSIAREPSSACGSSKEAVNGCVRLALSRIAFAGKLVGLRAPPLPAPPFHEGVSVFFPEQMKTEMFCSYGDLV